MSSAEKVSYIQNQPLPDDVAMLKTGRAPTTNKGELKKTIISIFLDESFCMVDLQQTVKWWSVLCVMFPQSDVQHQNTFVTQPFTAYKKAIGKTNALLKHQHSEHHTSAKSVYIVYL